MKVRASVKPMCKNCRVIRRRSGLGNHKRGGGRTPTVRIVCTNPKHKQRQG